MVASLVAIDLVVLAIYTLVEGVKGGLFAKLVVHRELPTKTEGVRISYSRISLQGGTLWAFF